MAKKEMVKVWSRAMVTYNGGVSMTTRGVKFIGGRVKPITNRKLAEYLKGKPKFSVQDEFTEVEVEVDPDDEALVIEPRAEPKAVHKVESRAEPKAAPKAAKTRKTRKTRKSN